MCTWRKRKEIVNSSKVFNSCLKKNFEGFRPGLGEGKSLDYRKDLVVRNELIATEMPFEEYGTLQHFRVGISGAEVANSSERFWPRVYS